MVVMMVPIMFNYLSIYLSIYLCHEKFRSSFLLFIEGGRHVGNHTRNKLRGGWRAPLCLLGVWLPMWGPSEIVFKSEGRSSCRAHQRLWPTTRLAMPVKLICDDDNISGTIIIVVVVVITIIDQMKPNDNDTNETK